MCGGGRFTVLNVFIKREEMSQIGDISFPLRNKEKKKK